LLNADERFFLIDCGEGTQLQLRKYKAKLSRLNHIFITHLHGDHIFGLPGLISSLNLLDRKQDLHIYANAHLEKILTQFLSNFFVKLDFTIVYHPLNANAYELIYEDNKLTVHSFPLRHRIPACGFIFKEKLRMRNIRKDVIQYHKIPIKEIVKIKNGADFVTEEGNTIPNNALTLEPAPVTSYAFCSDTSYSEAIIPFIKDVELLYHEATFSEEDKDKAEMTFHSTASEAATIAKLANAGKLVIGHFSARYKDITPLLEQARRIFPETEAAEDGMKIEL